MDIRIDGNTLSIPNGTLAIFVDPSGKAQWVGLVNGDVFQDAMTQPLGSIDTNREPHSEVELKVSNVQPSASTLTFQGAEELRVCRDMSGNVIRCPPR